VLPAGELLVVAEVADSLGAKVRTFCSFVRFE
jgi:hypothetical protein